ncbi:CAP-Gly domain-containing linker protein 2 [Elysia marginata]|uniref:CAP-Gly domain-containing linker protein 2 n=1 Tax=Elysia marginata TaxID=1093978 RepID=A0AAV4EQB7_9GAST|nr:CAP-Gly domain-containing linker protein 2 [Elysia marginata]
MMCKFPVESPGRRAAISREVAGSQPELNALVEDKEVAARAVAFVVNSTRKGIVPLCADIANLLRAKRSLEKKVYLLKRELEALRSSTSVSFRTSHSTSPTPPLLEKILVSEQAGALSSRPCSRSSQCSSTVSNSPKLDSNYSFKGYLPSPGVSADGLRRTSPRLPRQHHPKFLVNGQHTHSSSHSHSEQASQKSDLSSASATQRSDGNRKNSLPEMTSEPSLEVKRVSPKANKQIQCSLSVSGDSPREEQFIETVRLNSKLAEELGSAKKEIEVLKGRLKELEMNQLARDCAPQHSKIGQGDAREATLTGSRDNCSLIAPESANKATSARSRSKTSGTAAQTKPRPHQGGSRHSLLCAEPLYGCKCTACEAAMGGEIHAALSASLNVDLHKFPIGHSVLVQLGDHVVIKGDKTGRIRYIGHLDKIGQPNLVFAGLELDAPVGSHDGFFNKKRYFFCQKDHGSFIPLHDIICKVKQKSSATNAPADQYF